MNAKAQFSAFSAAFLLVFVVLYLLGTQWWVIAGIAVLAVPVNVVLYRRTQTAGPATR